MSMRSVIRSGIRGGPRRRVGAVVVVGLAMAAACGWVADAADATLYWANSSGDTIGEANNGGTDVNQSFIKGADGPADVVAAGRYIYWSNVSGCTEYGSCRGTIARAKLNGNGVDEHFIPAVTPYGLTVVGQYIYWANSGANTIGRANLNGTHVNQNFITGANQPNGVFVNGQNMYWANTGSNTIGEANLDGTNVNQNFITGADVPEGLAGNSDYIYWANHDNGTIGRATLAGTAVNQQFIANVGNWPTRVTLTSRDIYWTTWTGGDQVPSPGEIGEASLDGDLISPHLITSGGTPVGVAVTAGSISSAGAGRCAIKIGGPTRNVYHTYFNETVMGSACASANYVISGEQLNPAGGCASTYLAESHRSDWYRWPTGTGAVHGGFTLVAHFYARNHQKHGICSYLIRKATRKTYAHAARWWNNS
jgi:hypothetical protein